MHMITQCSFPPFNVRACLRRHVECSRSRTVRVPPPKGGPPMLRIRTSSRVLPCGMLCEW